MKLKIILLTLSILIFTLSLTGGIFFYRTAKTAAIQHNHIMAANFVNESADGIDSYLLDKRKAAARLAAVVLLEEALKEPNPATMEAANQVLDNFSSALGKGIAYLIDGEGTTLASSNRHRPDSFVGKDHAGIRSYFKEAIQGRPALFMGIGVTSKQPELYLSSPVSDSGSDRILGVAALKLPLDAINDEINQPQYHGITILTGPHGIIFLGNRQELLSTFLWEISETNHEKIVATRQFGPGPFPSSGLTEIDAMHAMDRHGHQYTIHQHNLEALPGWHLTFLHDDTLFVSNLSVTLTKKIGGTIVTALAFIILLVVVLYWLASREIRRRREAEEGLLENQQDLERQVKERTTELRRTNEELQQEIKTHKRDSKKLEYSNKTLEILNQVLRISQETITLQEFLNEFIQLTSSFGQLGLLPKGALLLAEDDSPDVLQLKAHYNLNETLLDKCNRVEFGHCLCGRAAETRKPVFASSIDNRHDTIYEGIMPHGHYCIPILSRNKKLLGVYNVYTIPNSIHDKRVEKLLVSVASVLASIIEYKRYEHKFRESHERHRAITDTAHEAIIMIDHQDKITFWNPAAERLFHYETEEVLGRKLHDLIVPERDRQRARAGFSKFITSGRGTIIGKTVEMTGLKKNGVEFPVELSVSALRQGRYWAAISILRDITERKTAEAEKRKMEQQLRQAQKMEAIGTLASGIAHDFNNILSSILGYADLLKDELPPNCHDNLADLDLIIQAGNRARELVKQILTFSRQNEEEIHPIQVGLVVKEALKLLRASFPSNIEIQKMISAGSATVMGDPTQIHQIIMNLCTNSYQAMRDRGGVLSVRLEGYVPDMDFMKNHPEMPADQYLRLTVSDTGRGMSPAILPRIFDPYFSTNKKEDGTGLGLSVVHGIVKKMGGVIEVCSRQDAGSTFEVFMPIFQGVLDQAAPTPEATTLAGTESILLVDDEQAILQLEERMLDSLGYQTTCRTSSVEALELFRNQPDRFDLVVTDHSMPNMTGVKLAESMLAIRPDIPIILCTGYFELDVSKKTGGKFVRQIIMKPTNKATLAAAIRQELDGKGNNRDS
jgi:PAS domain S-box-containing protein